MRHGKIYRRMAGGPRQRINLLRHFITTLVKYERFEAPFAKAHETQKYAEKLIDIAKRGDTDEEAMKIADYWLTDKRQVHKLFKVLAPRFQDRKRNYTQLLRVPGFERVGNVAMAFLEFHGNPYPPLRPPKKRNPDWLVNVLIREAVQELRASKVVSKALEEGQGPQTGSEDMPVTGPEDVERLRTVLDSVYLGESQSVDTKKDGTPV
ncbi:39S ribosomal protein L17, mitochondrial-like [Acanthaster planci]|uniref:Large ribosomal subunit protein bL17m n=1 Tax=Acanthaster planci TaxID=133434 RepID=A0A8B7ZZA3_ACAPL|nr:39S ribosomal protein L17, mitochondrial-like [Acanthaster planci]